MYQLWLTSWLVITDNHSWCVWLPSQPCPPSSHKPPGALQGGLAQNLPRREFGSCGRELLIRLLCRCLLARTVSESRGGFGRFFLLGLKKMVPYSILTCCEFGEHKLEVLKRICGHFVGSLETKSMPCMLIVPGSHWKGKSQNWYLLTSRAEKKIFAVICIYDCIYTIHHT